METLIKEKLPLANAQNTNHQEAILSAEKQVQELNLL